MSLLPALLTVPMVLLALALAKLPTRVLARSGAVLSWLQVGIGAALVHQALSSRQALVEAGCRVDIPAAWFLLITLGVAAAALSHAVTFFDGELAGPHPPTERVVRQFYGCTALFIASMSLVCCADNLGLLWICIEATTLTSAPLVYYHRSRTALEATWKYLIICSVGIALAFFGTAVLFDASQQVAALGHGSLSLSDLTAHARALPAGLLRLGFLFALLGYGTKAGLYPLHTWLPDAHSEAPAPASAMLSGALLNCALLGLWRLAGLLDAAGQGHFVRATLLPMALVTVLAASLMLLRQRDLKRLLAYSSMENVGLMAVAIALGNGTGLAAQALCHSVAKVALFLLAGNLLQEFGSKALADIRGLALLRPREALVLALAVAAVAGTPPFGNFFAEWQILSAAADGGHAVVVGVVSVALAIAFVALARHLVDIVWGDPPLVVARAARPRLWVPALLTGIGLLLSLVYGPLWLGAGR